LFGNNTTKFESDGSGYLAGGNIRWTVNKDVTISNSNLKIGSRPA
jgi:hypothetical protein